ncbi:glycosyltransferase family 2 protein [Ilumatobacter sp.]|uniref:glycosyltransferase family 2 protein n=1 Tax=Ilumatobacter sp. TaxID=1967498 RepID=UPI003B52C8C8
MSAPTLTWVILTMGNRPDELRRAIASALHDDPGVAVVVVANGAGPIRVDDERVDVVELAENVGAPGGRDVAVRRVRSDLVGFLDDDAELAPGATARIRGAFAREGRLGAVTLHLVDEDGRTQRRHLPRIGASSADVGGEVALLLEGACAMRRSAYLDAGGYFTDLIYAHEAVELCWRLVDRGWAIRYLADVEVLHPRTPIGRHPDGWRRTGRNRVWIARRTLPWPVAAVHVVAWLVEGARRAPAGEPRRSYLAGWVEGWQTGSFDRAPIGWRTVWRLTRLGRPPVV